MGNLGERWWWFEWRNEGGGRGGDEKRFYFRVILKWELIEFLDGMGVWREFGERKRWVKDGYKFWGGVI